MSARASSPFARVIGPLVDTLVDDQCADMGEEAMGEEARGQVRDYVLATVAAMPDFFRLGFHMLAYLFEFTPILRGERRFSRLAPVRRQAHVARWRGSPLGPMRSMIAFYVSFSAYGLYSTVYHTGIDEGGRIAA